MPAWLLNLLKASGVLTLIWSLSNSVKPTAATLMFGPSARRGSGRRAGAGAGITFNGAIAWSSYPLNLS